MAKRGGPSFKAGDRVRVTEYEEPLAKEAPYFVDHPVGLVISAQGRYVNVRFPENVYGNKLTWPMKPHELELVE